jgi:hypothetical protein
LPVFKRLDHFLLDGHLANPLVALYRHSSS